MRMLWCCGVAGMLLLVGGAASDGNATVIAPGYVVGTIATPGVATGGVVARGGVLLVGVGPFGATAQSVVRVETDGSATTLADGFNALSGFVYDEVNDRLVVGDNAGELAGAETGDTIYAIADPFGRTGSALRARDLELIPAGAIPGAGDVILDPADATGHSFFVSDAFFPFPGPPNGKLWAVDDVTRAATAVQNGLGYAAGLAALGDRLFLGEVDASNFSGRVSSVGLPSATGTRTLLAGDLAGQGDLVVASDGTLLATASGFGAGSFVLRIDPLTGAVTTLASGFGYASALAEENGTIYVVDGDFAGLSQVFVLTKVPEPGSALLALAGCVAIAWRRQTLRRACA